MELHDDDEHNCYSVDRQVKFYDSLAHCSERIGLGNTTVVCVTHSCSIVQKKAHRNILRVRDKGFNCIGRTNKLELVEVSGRIFDGLRALS